MSRDPARLEALALRATATLALLTFEQIAHERAEDDHVLGGDLFVPGVLQ